MSKVEIELNTENISKLLKSQEMAEMLQSRTREIARRAGTGYETDVYKASSRYISSAYAATGNACRDTLENNTLLRALK